MGATLHVPSSAVGLSITASGVTLASLHVLGPGDSSYDGASIGVRASGSSGAMLTGLSIRSSEIGDFGGWGIYLHFTSGAAVSDNNVHDCGYAGIMLLSASGGSVSGNMVQRIGYGVADLPGPNNAYGISLTDLNGQPASSGTTVSGNTVTDVPTWHAMDTHGGQRITFSSNTILRASRGLFITTDGNGNRPSSISVTGNVFGSPAPVSFNLQAITTYDANGVTVTGNSWSSGWQGNYFQDYDNLSTGLVISNNTLTQ